MAHSAPPGVYI
jgi:hypothetical protein